MKAEKQTANQGISSYYHHECFIKLQQKLGHSASGGQGELKAKHTSRGTSDQCLIVKSNVHQCPKLDVVEGISAASLSSN